MIECINLEKCSFMKTYRDDPKMKLALQGFVLMYCKGGKQDKCIRKKISKTLGGGQYVPSNMLPNGYPLAGTSTVDWGEDVRLVLK